MVTAAVWMTPGLALGLITLSLVALRRDPGPPSDRAAVRDETLTPAQLETPESLVRQGFYGTNVPPGL